MNKIFNLINGELEKFRYNYQLKIRKDPFFVSHRRWVLDHGDKTHRLRYDLNKSSIVFDVGGFEGQWSQDIYDRYKCSIYVFEPVPYYFKLLSDRFHKNDFIIITQAGLGNKNKLEEVSVMGDKSSVFKKIDKCIKVEFVDVYEFIKNKNIKKIDLLKLNIEGGEYDVLERLIETGLIKNITDIQVQFHNFVPDAKVRMAKIQKNLEKTHKITYQYLFIWENWRLKK